MCYILYMEKDIIYIEPENDITDIIAKIEAAKAKIVALVPPKKAAVLKSLINVKLIAKAGVTHGKNIVLVTTDPAIIKLAAAVKLPVAQSLQSAPVIPTIEAEAKLAEPTSTTIEDVADGEEEGVSEAPGQEGSSTPDQNKTPAKAAKQSEEDEAENEEEAPKKPKKAKKAGPKLTGNKILDWLKLHKKLAGLGGVVGLGLIGFLVWALAIAPALTVAVTIEAESNNFSESIRLTTNVASAEPKDGLLPIEEKKLEMVQEIPFEATGTKNLGEKASGEVVVYTYFKERSAVAINAGSSFSINGLTFVSSENATLFWDGEDDETCDNSGQTSSLVRSGCQVSTKIKVTAANAGTDHNIAASNSGWTTTANVTVYSDHAMSGGTDKIIKVVQQSDVEKAKAAVVAANEDENKTKLYDSIEEGDLIIDASFNQTTSSATATPAVDEEIKEGTQPTLKVTTTATVYVVEKVKLDEFIKAKVELGDDQKIYEIKDTFIENFLQTGNEFTGKLKAVYFIGPKITETEVVEKIKGKGLGDAQREIRDIYGVSSVTMEPSVPWVMRVPGDSNKVTVRFEVKDKEGQTIEDKAENDAEEKDKDKKESEEEQK